MQKTDASSFFAIAVLALENQDYPAALAACDQALRVAQPDAGLHAARGLALDGLERQEEAAEALCEALRLKPDFLQALDVLGLVYQSLRRLDEAEAVMRKAIGLAGGAVEQDTRETDENHYREQHWNLALLELLRGDFRSGFAHYRARFKKPGRAPRLNFPQPLWRGEDLRGKKILVVGEQGFGDVIMMCRFLPTLKARGATVILLVQDALAPLIRQSNLADEIIGVAPQAQGDFDFQASLFDLPHLFGTTLETIPADIPYITAPPLTDATKLPDDGRKRVGIVWAGRRDFGNDRRRSLKLDQFTPLLARKDTQFFSLMRDLGSGDAEFLTRRGVVDLSARLHDFCDAAAFIGQLDLVISCDTATAHLAGALGKKIWTLLPYAPDWRWLLDRDDSPWYPSMRLFRQKIRGDWDDVIARVDVALNTDLLA